MAASRAENLVGILEVAAVAAFGYVIWKRYTDITSVASDLGGEIGTGIYNLFHSDAFQVGITQTNGITLDVTKTFYKVIGGDVYRVEYKGNSWQITGMFDWGANVFVPNSSALPSDWTSLPNALNGFPQLKAGGQVWYS